MTKNKRYIIVYVVLSLLLILCFFHYNLDIAYTKIGSEIQICELYMTLTYFMALSVLYFKIYKEEQKRRKTSILHIKVKPQT